MHQIYFGRGFALDPAPQIPIVGRDSLSEYCSPYVAYCVDLDAIVWGRGGGATTRTKSHWDESRSRSMRRVRVRVMVSFFWDFVLAGLSRSSPPVISKSRKARVTRINGAHSRLSARLPTNCWHRSTVKSLPPVLNSSPTLTQPSPVTSSSESDCCNCWTVWPTPAAPRSRTGTGSCCRTGSSGHRYKTCDCIVDRQSILDGKHCLLPSSPSQKPGSS